MCAIPSLFHMARYLYMSFHKFNYCGFPENSYVNRRISFYLHDYSRTTGIYIHLCFHLMPYNTQAHPLLPWSIHSVWRSIVIYLRYRKLRNFNRFVYFFFFFFFGMLRKKISLSLCLSFDLPLVLKTSFLKIASFDSETFSSYNVRILISYIYQFSSNWLQANSSENFLTLSAPLIDWIVYLNCRCHTVDVSRYFVWFTASQRNMRCDWRR